MKKYFSSGLVILLPVVLTMITINFLVNFLTEPFLELTKNFLGQLQIFQSPFFLFQHSTLVTFLSKTLIIFILIGFVIIIGLVGKLFLIDIFFRLGDYLFHRLPFINKIYKACQDVVCSLFSSSSKKFSQVVFTPFPNSQSLSLGLVANEFIQVNNDEQKSDQLISVFIPGTPNPSVGFMLMFKREQLLFVNMKVEEAMKFIVSCGIVMPDFEIVQPQEDYDKQLFNKDYVLSSEKQFIQNSFNLHKGARSF